MKSLESFHISLGKRFYGSFIKSLDRSLGKNLNKSLDRKTLYGSSCGMAGGTQGLSVIFGLYSVKRALVAALDFQLMHDEHLIANDHYLYRSTSNPLLEYSLPPLHPLIYACRVI